MGDVVLVGSFGPGNPGDAALREAFRSELQAHSLTVHNVHPSAPVERSARTALRRLTEERARHHPLTPSCCAAARSSSVRSRARATPTRSSARRRRSSPEHDFGGFQSPPSGSARPTCTATSPAACAVGSFPGSTSSSSATRSRRRCSTRPVRHHRSGWVQTRRGSCSAAPSKKDRFVGDRRTITVVVSHRDIDAVTVERLAEALARVPGEMDHQAATVAVRSGRAGSSTRRAAA